MLLNIRHASDRNSVSSVGGLTVFIVEVAVNDTSRFFSDSDLEHLGFFRTDHHAIACECALIVVDNCTQHDAVSPGVDCQCPL